MPEPATARGWVSPPKMTFPERYRRMSGDIVHPQYGAIADDLTELALGRLSGQRRSRCWTTSHRVSCVPSSNNCRRRRISAALAASAAPLG